MSIRPHRLADATAIADILADCWKAAYSGFMPAEILEPRIDKAYRRAEVEEWLKDDFDAATEHLLVHETDAVDGFIHIVLEDKADLGASAHINLLYVDPPRFGQGIGRRLLAAAADWLSPRITGAVVLSAYAKNPHHPFYAHLGATEALRQTNDFNGHKLEGIYYHWQSPTHLKAGSKPTS